MKVEQSNEESDINRKNNDKFITIKKGKEIINYKTIEKDKNFLKIKMLLFIFISIILFGIIVDIPFFLQQFSSPERINRKIIKNRENDLVPLESEFKINTKINDLKRFLIIEKIIEDIKRNGQVNQISKYRETYYDIYIIAEENSYGQFKNFYNKTYNAAVLLVSECLNTNNSECIQRKFVDLTEQNYSKTNNIENYEDLKDIPIPICLFNFSDNGVILSMDCPESLPENQ